MPSAQDHKKREKLPRRSPDARMGDAIRVSAKDSESYAEILKAMNAKVNMQNAGYGHMSRDCTLSGREDAGWRCGGASHVAKECKALPRYLLMQTARERRAAVLLICKQHK